MNQEISADPVITEVSQGQGIITLNRPQVLNALSLQMIETITHQLDDWERDAAVKAVIFKGAGDRAFCAGGDMKAVYHALVAGKNPIDYFRAEYSLNRRIFNYPKPTEAHMHGIVMGGGYGIGGNCKKRIVGSTTIFAMPESAIGFFPDVGSMYNLTRCPHNTGRYAALTGARLTAQDMIDCGLADQVCGEVSAGYLKTENIARIFAFENLRDIIEALKSDESDWARETLSILQKKSPTSLAVINEYYNRARGQNFDYVIETDLLLAQKFLESHDLKEGVRAVLIDKDQNPEWRPDVPESMDNRAIARYFEPSNLPL